MNNATTKNTFWLIIGALIGYHLIIHTVSTLKILFGFALIIGIHELGHAIAAILVGVEVNRFSIGIGPGISFKVPFLKKLILSPFLIGGFVEIDEESTAQKSFWKKFFISINGMVANVLLAITLLVIGGANFLKATLISLKIWLWGWPLTIQAFTSGQATVNDMSGPVGISGMLTSNTYKYITMLAILNLAVAMFNLLPLPPLDGGRILVHMVEKIFGAERANKFNYVMTVVGTILLIVLMLFVTSNDLQKLFFKH